MAASRGVISSRSGTIIRVKAGSGGGSPAVISVDGMPQDMKAIIIGMQVTLETDASYMRSLTDNFYVFPFGDKPSDLLLDLMIISEACTGSGGATDQPLSFSKGLKEIADFYKTNRVKNSSVKVIKVTLGGGALVLNGLLTSMRIIGSVDDTAPSVRASLSMKAWPIE
jgi:hypothetical protein